MRKLAPYYVVAIGLIACLHHSFALAAETVPIVLAVTDPKTVAVPWGLWVSGALDILRDIIVTAAIAGVAWASKNAPALTGMLVRTVLTEHLIARSIDFGINSVQGAVKGKTLSVPVANDVLRAALSYATTYGWGYLIQWAGGEQGVRDKIIARLPLAAEGTLAHQSVAAPNDLSRLAQAASEAISGVGRATQRPIGSGL